VIAYFDTSAVIPLLVLEAGSEAAAELWNAADRVVSVRLVYAEARAALARAGAMGRLDDDDLAEAVRLFEAVYDEVDLIEIDDALVRDAGDLAQSLGLRGYDAVHLAGARRVQEDDLVVVGGDRALLAAAHKSGMAVAAVG
jgi:predicted nucleic acid-binding protein